MTSHPTPIINDDIPCMHCRYNLRGLPAVGLCPECGNAVEPSVIEHRRTADPLIKVDPKWVRRMGGAYLLLAGCSVCAVPVIIADEWVRDLYYNLYYDLRLSRDAIHRIRLGLYSLPWALSFVAAWRIGSREPHESTPDNPVARWALRACALTWLVTPILVNPPWQFSYDRRWFPLFVAAAPANLFIYWRAARLAARIPRPRLAMQCLFLALAVAVASAFQAISAGPTFLRRASADEVFYAAPNLGTGCLTLAMYAPDALEHTWRTGRFGMHDAQVVLAACIVLWSTAVTVYLGFVMRRLARHHHIVLGP